jgi:LPXTG-site transpeptidase (sortase) family protein
MAGVVLVIVGASGLHRGDHLPDSARADGSTSARPTGVDAPVIASPEPGSPQLVRIPALGISSRVVPIHAPNRALVPPSDPQRLGWWADGAKPGAARGSAVMTGHTMQTGGGALDDLETLRPGDTVVVRTDQETLRYVIRRVRIYDRGALDELAAAVFSQDVPGRLVLVTCEGWNGERYLSNVVVTATRRTSHTRSHRSRVLGRTSRLESPAGGRRSHRHRGGRPDVPGARGQHNHALRI